MQSEESARRLIDLGADPDARRWSPAASSSIRSSCPAPTSHRRPRANRVLRFFRVPPDRPVIIAGSTLRGEEAAVLDAFTRISATMTNALLDHRGRASPSASTRSSAWRADAGLATCRAAPSCAIDAEPRADVVVLDTIGELAQLYQVATASSSAAASSTPAATTSSSRRSSASQSSLVRTCRTSPRSREAFLEQRRRRSRCGRRASWRTALRRPAGRSRCGARGLGAAARALVEANRGAKDQDARRRSPSCCRPTCRAPWCGRSGGPLTADSSRLRGDRPARAASDTPRGPTVRRRLRRPVISVGNLAVGGSGKTPTVATIARLLLEMGERPAILSRGYARRDRADGVVVVRDGPTTSAPTSIAPATSRSCWRAQLPGASVLAAADRYLAGCLAERQFGCDGARAGRRVPAPAAGARRRPRPGRARRLARPATLPSGRLREPLDTLAAADAVIAVDDDVEIAASSDELPVFRAPTDAGAPGRDRGRAGARVCRDRDAASGSSRGWPASGWTSGARCRSGITIRYCAADVARIFREARAGGSRGGADDREGLRAAAAFPAVPLPAGFVPLTMEPIDFPIQALAGRLAVGGPRRRPRSPYER